MKKILSIMTLLLLFGCFEQENVPFPNYQNVSFTLLKSSSIEISRASCRVSAEDMDTLTAALTVSETQISGQISHVPFGEDRTFEIFCYDNDQMLNYYGSATADINSIAPVINVILYPVQSYATVTINGIFSNEGSSTEEKVVFTANWSGSYDVYVMDTDGSNIRQLTSSEGNDTYPQLSPDRSKVSFQRSYGNGPLCFIVDVETLELDTVDLEAYSAQCVSWHPSENYLLFHSNYYGTCDIFKYDLSTETVTPLIVDDVTNWVPVSSPDGEHILFYSKMSDNSFRAYIANADGTDPMLVNPEGHADERLPHMCPADTNLILFSGRNYSVTSYVQFGLFITDRSTGNVFNLISTSGVNESWPDWSPDGNQVIYERNSGGNYGIYIINRDGTGNTALIDTPGGNEKYPHWR